MSYSCEISFKHVDSVTDVFQLLPQLKAKAIECFPDIARENCMFMPIPHRKDLLESFDMTDPEIRKPLYLWARTSIFSFRFFYIEKMHLLGIFSLPSVLQTIMDGSVYFQNSGDQNYDRNNYQGITEFEDIYDKWISMTADELISYYADNSDDHSRLTEDDIAEFRSDNEALMNHLKSLAYDEIWSYCEQALYDDDSAVFLSLFGAFDHNLMRKFIIMSVNDFKSENEWLFAPDEPQELPAATPAELSKPEPIPDSSDMIETDVAPNENH